MGTNEAVTAGAMMLHVLAAVDAEWDEATRPQTATTNTHIHMTSSSEQTECALMLNA